MAASPAGALLYLKPIYPVIEYGLGASMLLGLCYFDRVSKITRLSELLRKQHNSSDFTLTPEVRSPRNGKTCAHCLIKLSHADVLRGSWGAISARAFASR